MASFLLVSLRNGDIGPQVAAAEYCDVLKASGLSEDELDLRILDEVDTAIGDVSAYRGIIVGGSSLNVTNPTYCPWQEHIHAELDALIRTEVPVFFVCFGISWLIDALGGTVGNCSPEASGPTVVKLTEAGKRDPLLAGFPDTFDALTGHTENPERIPAGVEVLATGSTTPVQIARWGKNVWASQFHAEMDAAAMKTRMDFFYDYGYFPLTEYDTIVAALPSVDVRWSNKLLRRFVEYCRAT
ncbi:glutamine amidotransferase [Corynebacterium mayonis]|uniref:glutamine amidotransferase n=1 Tax=Corynebacterium mayonis TaxID=3062461 RepID=UPI0031403411